MLTYFQLRIKAQRNVEQNLPLCIKKEQRELDKPYFLDQDIEGIVDGVTEAMEAVHSGETQKELDLFFSLHSEFQLKICTSFKQSVNKHYWHQGKKKKNLHGLKQVPLPLIAVPGQQSANKICEFDED